MTDSDETSGKPDWRLETDPDGATIDDIREYDHALTWVMDAFLGGEDEHEDTRIAITLTIPSGIVSGQLISRKAWMRGSAERLNEAREGLGDSLLKAWMFTEETVIETRRSRREAGAPPFKRTFIHLRDVRVISGGSRTNMAFWRGRLESVSGWDFGGWQPDDE